MSSGFGGDIAEWVADDGFAQQRHEVQLAEAWGPGGDSTKISFPDGSTIEIAHDYGPVHARGVLVEKHEVSVSFTGRGKQGGPFGIVFFYDTDAEPLAARFVRQAIAELWQQDLVGASDSAELGSASR